MTADVDAFVSCFGSHAVNALIRNLTTRVERLDLGGMVVPITINDGGIDGNCYICNPVASYTDYAIEETRNFGSQPALRQALIGLIRSVSPIVRATRLDRAVHINNWLFSTNPAPLIDEAAASLLIDTITASHPAHAIVLRSLNTHVDQQALDALQSAGFQLLPARQIYLFDARKPVALSRDMKNDLSLLRKTPYVAVADDGFSDSDYERCAELYSLLYLEKYTPLNPQYTADFIKRFHQLGIIELQGLRGSDGQLAAIGGRFQYGETLTQPLLGYDTTRAQREGLYRLITALAQHDAIKDGLLFNMSAGAAGFKRHRGAIPAIEYTAVYTAHLPRRQRVATTLVAGLLSRVGVPLLKRYEL